MPAPHQRRANALRKLDERRTMDEPPTIHPQGPGDEPPGWPAPEPREIARRSLLRRLLALLVAGGTAFTFTTWVLVRYENPLGILRPLQGPAKFFRRISRR